MPETVFEHPAEYSLPALKPPRHWRWLFAGLAALAAVASIDAWFSRQHAMGVLYLCCPLLASISGRRRWTVVTSLLSAAIFLQQRLFGTSHFPSQLAIVGEAAVVASVPLWLAFLQLNYRRERQLARRDPLTGVSNRQGFVERLQTEILQNHRQHRPFTVVMLDCDQFKALNDREGHAYGDLALRTVATTLRFFLRPDDVVARIGGDEFALILVNTTPPIARMVLERIQAHLWLHLQKRFPDVTLSLGAVTFWTATDVSTCLRLSDEAMYAVKNRGKNGIEFRVEGNEPGGPVLSVVG